jgi:hypothetical protein
MILHPSSRTRRLGLPMLSAGDRLARDLGRRLDDDHHWFRDVAAGGTEPIDAVVVGPGGTFALTRGGENGRFTRRNTGHWYRWNRSTESWVPWDPVPITAARLAARRLGLYLERAGLPAAVVPILVPTAAMSVEVPRGDDLGLLVQAEPEQLARSMSAEEVLSQAQVDRIVALLDPRQPLPRLAQATRGG